MPRKRGVARYCATRIKAGRLWALRQSPRSGLARRSFSEGGVGSDEGEKRKEKNPDAKRAGTEETGLFEMVNRKRRGAMHRQGAGAPSRQRQRTRDSPRARASTRLLACVVGRALVRSETNRARAMGLADPRPVLRIHLLGCAKPRCARAATDRSPRLRAATDPARRPQPVA
jgi:hypothetical protein